MLKLSVFSLVLIFSIVDIYIEAAVEKPDYDDDISSKDLKKFDKYVTDLYKDLNNAIIQNTKIITAEIKENKYLLDIERNGLSKQCQSELKGVKENDKRKCIINVRTRTNRLTHSTISRCLDSKVTQALQKERRTLLDLKSYIRKIINLCKSIFGKNSQSCINKNFDEVNVILDGKYSALLININDFKDIASKCVEDYRGSATSAISNLENELLECTGKLSTATTAATTTPGKSSADTTPTTTTSTTTKTTPTPTPTPTTTSTATPDTKTTLSSTKLNTIPSTSAKTTITTVGTETTLSSTKLDTPTETSSTTTGATSTTTTKAVESSTTTTTDSTLTNAAEDE